MVATFLGNPPMNVFPATYIGEVFQVSSQVVRCPVALQTHLELTPTQTIDLGIRPEHIEITELIDREGTEDNKNNQLILEVSVVEPLGRETLVRSNLIGSDIVLNVQAPANWRGHPGDRISVQLDLDKLFVFDPNTGDVLYP
jgi:multiple sugar transport system ATP-binding protein